MTATEPAVDVDLLSRIVNYLFLQTWTATCNHMYFYEWYSDGWRLAEDLLEAEKLECQRSNT